MDKAQACVYVKNNSNLKRK